MTRQNFSLTNRTFDEIKVGDRAQATRRVSSTEVEALALVSGDVDAFHLKDGEPGAQEDGIEAKAVGAEALLSGLLSRRMPGPGTTIVAQDLRFEGAVRAGDELTGSVTVREKRPEGHQIVFDCLIERAGTTLISGTVTVAAPTRRISYSNVATPELLLRRNDAFAKLLKE
ncbi:MAG: enoyl-CoA hydratase, partial [Betaproteobacteria bacterium SG8_39]